jgi:aspartyl-tRNA(Asn)/glutamyl-tRNA(Gln) amidotransferase subunit A
LAGLPAVSIPAGFSKGLPLGLQIIANKFEENKIFQAGFNYQQETNWHKKFPNI